MAAPTCPITCSVRVPLYHSRSPTWRMNVLDLCQPDGGRGPVAVLWSHMLLIYSSYPPLLVLLTSVEATQTQTETQKQQPTGTDVHLITDPVADKSSMEGRARH